MTVSTYGLALHHIRLASLLSFSGVEDIMLRGLKSFAGIALRHLSSTEVGTKGRGGACAMPLVLPQPPHPHTHTHTFFCKTGWGPH